MTWHCVHPGADEKPGLGLHFGAGTGGPEASCDPVGRRTCASQVEADRNLRLRLRSVMRCRSTRRPSPSVQSSCSSPEAGAPGCQRAMTGPVGSSAVAGSFSSSATAGPASRSPARGARSSQPVRPADGVALHCTRLFVCRTVEISGVRAEPYGTRRRTWFPRCCRRQPRSLRLVPCGRTSSAAACPRLQQVVAHRKTKGDALGKAAEVAPHALTDRFQRLEPGCPRMGMDADALSGAMIDRDEHRRRALAGERRRQIVSTVSGMMVPSWFLGPRGEPTLAGASRSFSRINRSTRRNELRMAQCRNRAQTLRWPSPWNGLAASTARIAAVSASSDIAPVGPRRRGGGVSDRGGNW